MFVTEPDQIWSGNKRWICLTCSPLWLSEPVYLSKTLYTSCICIGNDAFFVKKYESRKVAGITPSRVTNYKVENNRVWPQADARRTKCPREAYNSLPIVRRAKGQLKKRRCQESAYATRRCQCTGLKVAHENHSSALTPHNSLPSSSPPAATSAHDALPS